MAAHTTESIDRATLLDIFRTAVLINQADDRLRTLLTGGELAIAYYSPRGQEVLAAAIGAALRTDDYLVTTYRGLHDQIAKGIPLNPLFAELFGRVDGTCKGKGGPMHVTHPASGVMVTTGVVGSGMPIATGLALSSQLRGDNRVTVVCFGDGATNIGAFHESLNLASVWKLPVIFVCQNNFYAESSTYALGTSAEHIADRAGSYRIPGVRVDGNDAAAMFTAASAAVDRARAGDGPTLIEAETFRFMGHYFGDPGAYIEPSIYDRAVANDPLPALRNQLSEAGIDDETLTAIRTSAVEKVEAAIEFARNSPAPGVEELRRDVYLQEASA